ncbi:FCD domain-containing protein [Streptomyces sp. SID8361]|uniref:GntR family transcriptional regulator n=1 Tax=Streptomyces TaxID=1883 RepID=UPI00081EC554|nr:MULTISPECIES: GntR family transcriptional regulator [unclassified Streptomyces]MYU13930.1 FCD domain-containing protein [Streptomyces sp. SID8361]AUA08605.1 putative HTH-type transcriptional regulator YdfH [Streptomyces sp. M56]MCM3808358.1 GntR family transcriptional regulator [Streptomyces sp. DR7-3]MYX59553.1 FCD domain-containing protein [Streptomyces sp. SID8382]SCG03420.1 transcriptional regulator, GntR family [Streptomyces sp. MnatMP-M27]
MTTADNAPLAPLAPASSLRDRVEEAIAAAIVSGQMPAGEVFSAPNLAARFGVSATPVREAMLNLAKRGMVDIVRNKGFRVTAVSEDELRAIVDVRQLLEGPAVRRLAGTLSGADLTRLRGLAEEIVRGARDGDLARYLQADTTFHLTLLKLVGNMRLHDIVADLRAQTRLTGLADLVATEELEASAHEHLDLLDLLEAGAADECERLMSRHIGHVLGWWAGQAET